MTPQSIAANVRWTRTVNRTAATAPARANSPSSPADHVGYWADQVDPDRVMDDETRGKAAANARKVYFARLTRAGIKARQAKKADRDAKKGAEQAVRDAVAVLGVDEVARVAGGGE